jgi:excisionase family DNA binding protein
MNTNDSNQRTMPTPLVYTVEEAAAALNCSTKTIRRLIHRGYFTPCKALRKILIPRGQIEAFLKSTCDVPKTLL